MIFFPGPRTTGLSEVLGSGMRHVSDTWTVGRSGMCHVSEAILLWGGGTLKVDFLDRRAGTTLTRGADLDRRRHSL